MNFKFIAHDIKASIKTWLRSKGTVFWTLMFPILMILIFGAIFSESDEINYPLVIQDLDESEFSIGFIENITHVEVLEIESVGKNVDIKEYMLDNDLSVALVIPEGFGDNVTLYLMSQSGAPVEIDLEELPYNLTFISDPSDASTAVVIRSILSSILFETNVQLTDGEKVIGVTEESSIGDDFDYIDFFVPGMIGFTTMTSCIYGSIERNTKYRKDGILRKLLTMPVSRADWILSKMLFMVFLSFISTTVIITVGMLVWGLSVKINLFFFILVILNSFLFSGMGMMISRFVKDVETADMAGGAITFPMMFLAGTFFPLDQMPDMLQHIAKVLPLYYVNEGLRNAMIYADFDKTIYFTAFTLAFALIFFLIGVFLTKWKEE